MDVMESWADDRPVNWNEKIVFSDEESQQQTTGEKNHHRDWTRDDSPDMNHKNENRKNEEKYEHRSYDRRRDYDNRYDSRYQPSGQSSGYDRNRDRPSSNYEYSRNSENAASSDHQSRNNGYQSRRHQREERNSRNFEEKEKRENYQRNYQKPIQRGFYDDYERGYYDREIEKTKEHKTGPGQKDGRRQSSTSETHQKRESDLDPNSCYDGRNVTQHSGGDGDDASSVTSLEIPLEEPEPETPKRKIIRVAKKVQLRDFTNEEKGEEEIDEEKEIEKNKEKEALKPRGWKTEENDGTDHDRNGKPMGKGERA